MCVDEMLQPMVRNQKFNAKLVITKKSAFFSLSNVVVAVVVVVVIIIMHTQMISHAHTHMHTIAQSKQSKAKHSSVATLYFQPSIYIHAYILKYKCTYIFGLMKMEK